MTNAKRTDVTPVGLAHRNARTHGQPKIQMTAGLEKWAFRSRTTTWSRKPAVGRAMQYKNCWLRVKRAAARWAVATSLVEVKYEENTD